MCRCEKYVYFPGCVRNIVIIHHWLWVQEEENKLYIELFLVKKYPSSVNSRPQYRIVPRRRPLPSRTIQTRAPTEPRRVAKIVALPHYPPHVFQKRKNRIVHQFRIVDLLAPSFLCRIVGKIAGGNNPQRYPRSVLGLVALLHPQINRVELLKF